ncbi:MAG TPA: alpha/beta hydrolase [Pseudonocardiaceae bacterium]|jgi:pimeloyl-ACP methyl ester carboxylesterase
MPEPALSVVDVDGCELALFDHGGGPGPALVLLHGGGRSAADWRDVARLLVAGGCRVVAFDLRGHGLSGAMGPRWSFDDAVADVDAVAAALGLWRPFVVGHSLGGLLAMRYGGRSPGCPGVMNVDGVGAALPATFPGPAGDRDRVRGFVDSVVASAIGAGGEPDPLGAAVLDFDVFSAMRAVRCPCHFVAATGGDQVSPEMALWRNAVVHEVRRLGIPVSVVDSGHLMPTQAPDALASIIFDWVRPQ